MEKGLLKNVYDKQTHIFVYDKYQKDFYLNKGVKMLDSDINLKTKKVFWVFSKEDTNVFYGEWLTECKKRHDLV